MPKNSTIDEDIEDAVACKETAIELIADYGNGEGEILVWDEFKRQNAIFRMDCLRDWIIELSDVYASASKEIFPGSPALDARNMWGKVRGSWMLETYGMALTENGARILAWAVEYLLLAAQ